MMTDKQAIAFMQKVNANAPFWTELHDKERPTISIHGNPIPRCLCNLILAKRYVNLYLKGIKPNRYWKIGDAKYNYGLKGDKQTIAEAINVIHDEFLGRFENPNNDGLTSNDEPYRVDATCRTTNTRKHSLRHQGRP